MLLVRPAKTADVKAIRALVDSYAAPGQMLAKETVTLYESVQEFIVAEIDGIIVGCGALHILWEDLAEVRTVAVKKDLHRQGVGHKILEAIIKRAGEVGVNKIFCLTFQTEFFGSHGFEVIEGTPVDPEVYAELCAHTMPVWPNSSTLNLLSRIPLATPEGLKNSPEIASIYRGWRA